MDKGWIGKSDIPIAAGDSRIIVWHIYQGVMVVGREEAAENPFMTHWREIDDDAWISAEDRMPTKDDADVCGCVISQDRWGEARTAGWHRFGRESSLVRWQHPPERPANFRDLQNITP